MQLTAPAVEEGHRRPRAHALRHQRGHQRRGGVAVEVGRHPHQRAHEDRDRPVSARQRAHRLGRHEADHQPLQQVGERQPLDEEQGVGARLLGEGAPPLLLGPEAPDGAAVEARAAAAAPHRRIRPHRRGEEPRPHRARHEHAARKPDAHRRRRLAQREGPPQRARGDHEARRVHQRRGQPERHHRRHRRPQRQQPRDEGDHLAGAEGREPAHQRGEHDHPRLVALEGTGDDGLGPRRLQSRHHGDRDGDEGQGGDEAPRRQPEHLRRVRGRQDRRRRRDQRDRDPDAVERVQAPPARAAKHEVRHVSLLSGVMHPSWACALGPPASAQHSRWRNPASV